MIVADTYDARAAANAFEREGSACGHAPTRLAGSWDRRMGPSAPRVPRDVDVIVVWGPPREAGSAVRALRRGGFAGLLVTGLRGADPRFVASAGPAVEGTLLVAHGHGERGLEPTSTRHSETGSATPRPPSLHTPTTRSRRCWMRSSELEQIARGRARGHRRRLVLKADRNRPLRAIRRSGGLGRIGRGRRRFPRALNSLTVDS